MLKPAVASKHSQGGAVMTDRTSLGHWIRRFLLEYVASERNLSANTCASYRDMLVLLLPFVAKRKGVTAREIGYRADGRPSRRRTTGRIFCEAGP